MAVLPRQYRQCETVCIMCYEECMDLFSRFSFIIILFIVQKYGQLMFCLENLVYHYHMFHNMISSSGRRIMYAYQYLGHVMQPFD